MKTCPDCRQEKALSEFSKQSQGHLGVRNVCKPCDVIRSTIWHKQNPERGAAACAAYSKRSRAVFLTNYAKERAVKKGLLFDLDKHRPLIQVRIDAGFCELSGIPFNLNGGRTFDSPSLDRIDSTGAYVYSNIRVVCSLMNSALGDWGEEVLYAVITAWLRKRERDGVARKDAGLALFANDQYQIDPVHSHMENTNHSEREPDSSTEIDEPAWTTFGNIVADSQSTDRRAEQQEHRDAHGRDEPGRGRNTSELVDADRTCAGDGELQRSGELGRTSEADGASATGIVGHPARRGLGINGSAPRNTGHADEPEQVEFAGNTDNTGPQGRLGVPERAGEWAAGPSGVAGDLGTLDHTADPRYNDAGEHGGRSPLLTARPAQPSATNGFWFNAEWIACRDGKSRPVEPGVAPLVDGATNRVGRLRGYGNAICAPVAEEFIRAYLGSRA